MSSQVQPTPPSLSGASNLAARLQSALNVWRTRLLDLSKRNRALNFKPTKVATVVIANEHPAEVFRHLCVDDKPMRFRPTLPSEAKRSEPGTESVPETVAELPLADDASMVETIAELPLADDESVLGTVAELPLSDNESVREMIAELPLVADASMVETIAELPFAADESVPETVAELPLADDESVLETVAESPLADDENDAPSLAELDFAPYDPEVLDDRHTDDILRAVATPEALDKSLRRIDEQARATIEEQGVNVLFLALGMLHYPESPESSTVLRAPLIMVPVTLSRRSARAGYTLQATDDEPMVNPALIEYLGRAFGITLPGIPAFGDGANEGADLQDFYRVVAEIASSRTGWSVKTDIFLGLFSFQKLVMFKDLEANAEAFGAHAMIRQLVSRELAPGAAVIGLPADVRSIELDREFAPEQTAQVVDADSSQLRAIAAVSKGHSLVLEGPPGTGKSQTITNLIAQALADGKSVLFVAEKMAALQVVHSRLVSAGLGEFCLELHASKANKRVVMQEIKAALDASLQRPSIDKSTQRLAVVRTQLSDYTRAAHTPAGSLGLSPFIACGMLDAVLDAPRVTMKARTSAMTFETLVDTERLLADLAEAAEPIGAPAGHPWRDSARTFYTPRALDELGQDLDAAAAKLEQALAIAADVERVFSLPPIQTFDDVKVWVAVVRLLGESPGAPLSVLQSDAWNTSPAEATTLIQAVRRLQRWRGQIDRKFEESVLDHDHAADVSFIEEKSAGAFSALSFLDARYRAIKVRWTAFRKPSYTSSLAAQANDLKLVDQYTGARAELDAKLESGQSFFGAHWQGERSDCDALDHYVDWVVKVREVCVRHGLSDETLAIATQPRPDVSRIADLEKAAHEAAEALAGIRTAVEWPAEYLASSPLAGSLERLNAMRSSPDAAQAWATFEQHRRQAAETDASELVALATAGSGQTEVTFNALARIFRRAVLERFLEDVIGEQPILREFRTVAHEQRLKEFRQLDERVLMENRSSVVSQLRENTQSRLQEEAARAGLPFIQREMAKQRNISPVRRTLQNAEAAVRAIKPCFLMSPLTVAQYLDGKAPSFDLVIFDEASQLPSEDAVGAIARGRQLVVVGDPKQLPPTSFFSITGTVGAPLGDDGFPVVEDSESVLEEYMGSGVPVTRLKWHYRSAHESLITFSNVSFYDADLYTFPSVETGSEATGVSFEYVADGVYEGSGLNRAEARRVADAVVRHAKERPHESLGVGTFNLRQQLAVLDELELRRREDPSIEPFFSRGASEPFFVKNLENIQGDERDVIFLSVTYARAADGKLRYNFGPINGENGWRRLNVLTTRARKRMRVFSSIRGEDINAAASVARGAHLLRIFLTYAEFGRLDNTAANPTATAESVFERQVVSELARRGVNVVPQIGVAGYRIDIGVLDDDVPGRFVCGIECDGVAYRSAETARDRDRLRQQVLEARGWTIIRVWSMDWFKDRKGQVDRLMRFIARAKDEAKERIRVQIEAKSRAGELAETEGPNTAEPSEQLGLEGVTEPYVRPTISTYQFAGGQGLHAGTDFLESATSHVVEAILEVARVEAPVHADDLATRVAGMWGLARMGSRIRAKIDEALRLATRAGELTQRGNFVWTVSLDQQGASLPLRSRAGTKIPGDRVAPEEIKGVIALVLGAAGGMTADELLSEVRQVMGIGKATMAPAFDAALQSLVSEGSVGEGSAGFALRS